MAEQLDHVVRGLGLGAGGGVGEEGDMILTELKSRQAGRGCEIQAIFGRSKCNSRSTGVISGATPAKAYLGRNQTHPERFV